jgi:CHAT domain-containing protein
VEPECVPGGWENPLVAAGLALAGANLRTLTHEGDEDGMLTAEEVAALDLAGTEWVVLSACETARGDVLSGEGVFGLQRAFQLAGARTVIVTLWPIDDAAARVWVRELYRKRFEQGLPTDEAVDGATRALLRKLRDRDVPPLPYLWGNFIAVGDWR